MKNEDSKPYDRNGITSELNIISIEEDWKLELLKNKSNSKRNIDVVNM